MKIGTMNLAQEGAYHRLLCFAWVDDDCGIPNDEGKLKLLVRWLETYGEFSPVMACFEPHPDNPLKLINRRLYLERQKVYERSKQKQRAAEIRWHPKVSLTLPKANGRDYLGEADQILQFLNEKSGRVFRGREANGRPSTNLEFILARLKAGVDVQTCKTLIARKVRDWKDDPKMMKFLRPETLFNRTKFESYLAEVSS